MRLPIPSIRDFGLLAIAVMLLVSGQGTGGRNLLADGDAFYHIRAGQWMIEHKSLPQQEPFSYGMEDKGWIAHEWLAEVVSAIFFNFFGLDGVCLLYAVLIGLSFYLLIGWVGRRWGFLSSVLMTTLFFISSIHWLARPHVWTHFFLVLYLIGLDRWDRNERVPMWFFPGIMLAWVNLHGGYMSGFLLLGIAWVQTFWHWLRQGRTFEAFGRLRNFTLILALSVLASCINPYGLTSWLNVLRFAGNSSLIGQVHEFLSPDFKSQWPFLGIYGIVFFLFAVSRRGVTISELFRVFIFGVLSLQSMRHIPLFVFVMSDGLGRRIRDWVEGPKCPNFLRTRLKNYEEIEAVSIPGLWPAVILVVSVTICATGYDFKPSKKFYSNESFQYLRTHKMLGKVLNSDEIGDYMIWELWPDYKVYVDGRLDFYEGRRLKDYMTLINMKRNMERVLRRSAFDWAFIQASGLERYLSVHPDWLKVYSDSRASIFVNKRSKYFSQMNYSLETTAKSVVPNGSPTDEATNTSSLKT